MRKIVSLWHGFGVAERLLADHVDVHVVAVRNQRDQSRELAPLDVIGEHIVHPAQSRIVEAARHAANLDRAGDDGLGEIRTMRSVVLVDPLGHLVGGAAAG